MTIAAWLATATHQLATAGVESARLDALILLEDSLGQDRTWILAHDDSNIPDEEIPKLKNLLTERAKHLPLAYLRGHTEFYGRRFTVSPAVLEPRPESETMITLLKQLHDDGKLAVQGAKTIRIADIGTGSGALGITAALELPEAIVELVEVDQSAAEIAQLNVDLFTLKIPVILSDLLGKSSQDYTALLCNLPYVPDGYQINRAAGHEPAIALFGGPDGLDLYRKLFTQTATLPFRPLYILTESLLEQHDSLQAIADRSGYNLETTEGLIQVFRLK